MDDQNKDVLAQDDAAPIETAEKPASLRDALVSAKEELTPIEPAAEPVEGKARDEKGRFAAKADEPVKTDAPPREVGTEPRAEQPVKVDQPKADAQGAPRNWSPEARAKWDALPPEVQREIARRETDFARGFSQKAREFENDRKFAAEVRSVFEPFRQNLQANGLSDLDGVKWLLGRYQLSREQPEVFIREFAHAAGVDLAKLTGAAAETPQAPQPVDLSRYLQPLQQEIAAHQQKLTAIEQATMQAHLAEFAATRPYFQQARYRMGALLKAQQAESLEDAYNIAVSEIVDPIRKSLTEEQRAAQDAERARREADAAKARQASGSVNGAPMAGARPPGAPAKTVRDAVRAAYQQVGGRA